MFHRLCAERGSRCPKANEVGKPKLPITTDVDIPLLWVTNLTFILRYGQVEKVRLEARGRVSKKRFAASTIVAVA